MEIINDNRVTWSNVKSGNNLKNGGINAESAHVHFQRNYRSIIYLRVKIRRWKSVVQSPFCRRFVAKLQANIERSLNRFKVSSPYVPWFLLMGNFKTKGIQYRGKYTRRINSDELIIEPLEVEQNSQEIRSLRQCGGWSFRKIFDDSRALTS